MQARSSARLAALAVAGVAYVAASHWLMTRAQASPWNAVAELTPMLALIAIGAWRNGQRAVGSAALLAIAALCAQAALGVNTSPHALYLAQHAGVNFFLALVFGSTLRAGHTALITTLAARVHGGNLVPAMAIYTRNVTRAWTIFFIAIVAISLGLYAFAGFEAWAVFANWITPVAIGAMFGGEYLLRYRLHPEFERSTVAEAVRAYMSGGRSPAAEKSAVS